MICSGGYSVDRTVGNTGGLGGLFGILHAVGGNEDISVTGGHGKVKLKIRELLFWPI